MVSSVFENVEREADALPPDEQLRLIERLAERLAARPVGNRTRWEDFAGIVASPMCGEDAQDWVTRNRQESEAELGKTHGRYFERVAPSVSMALVPHAD
jgi:hypothetical protein